MGEASGTFDIDLVTLRDEYTVIGRSIVVSCL